MQKQTFALTIVTLFTLATFVLSATDTPETRRREAERYLKVIPPKALFEDMADKMAANLPPDRGEKFNHLLPADLDIAALTKAMTDAMLKNFTNNDVKHLAGFYV